MNIQEIINNQKVGREDKNEQRAVGSYGMASSPVREATEIGTQVLKDGGNAIDAVVAMQFALSVTEGMNTGIGGSGYLMIYDSRSNETKLINGHTTAPSGANPEMFLDDNGDEIPFGKRTIDAKSVGVPKIMKAMELALDRYGSIPLDRLIEPAIQLAEKGFRVNWLWQQAIEMYHTRLGDEARKLYIPNGISLIEGDWIKQPELAKTLRMIQKEGISALYEGEIADAIIQTIVQKGGIMTKDDLLNNQVTIEEPLWSSYKDFDLALPKPPNAAGFAVAHILKLLESFNIGKFDIRSWQKYYLLSESMRITFSDKFAYMNDPDFIEVPLEGLLHPDYIEERRKLINFRHRNIQVDFGNPWKYQEKNQNHLIKQSIEEMIQEYREGNETTHFTAVDRLGNVAACTSSIDVMFGSGIMVPEYGFLLNNELTDFSPVPRTVNDVRPGKHPVSAKCPTIVFHKGKPFLTLGSPGSSTIISSVLQVLLNVIEYKMDLKDAIEEPRIFSSTSPLILWEAGVDREAMVKMIEMNYEWAEQEGSIGNVQAILIDSSNGRLYGAADSTRPGAAIGLD